MRRTASIDRNFARGVWRADSKGVVATVPDGTTTGLWEIPLGGAPQRRDIGRLGVTEFDVAADGRLAFIRTDALHPL